jgi:hypothetical protein
MKARRLFGRDIPKPGRISPMQSGATLIILCRVIGVSLSGFSQAQMQMENDQKWRGAIYSHFAMERFLSKILIEKVDP